MSKLKYKDYYGSVEYEDGTLIVQILHIDDVIITECKDASKVEKCFAELVDDYLETCAAIGKEPSKPFRGSFNVRIAPEIHKAAFHLASRRNMTLNAWVSSAIETRVRQESQNIEFLRKWRVNEEMHGEVFEQEVKTLRVAGFPSNEMVRTMLQSARRRMQTMQ